MAAKIYLALALHNHQPVGNFDFVFEEAYNKSYLPMLEALERHPGVRLAMHNTGPLLDWLFANRPEYIERMSALVARNQIEIMTGGYYEPILVALSDSDKHAQITKLTKTVRDNFDYAATGAWLAERIWEPHLPRALNTAGVGYTIVDDTHFRYAGLDDDDMFGYYITEEQGYPVKIFGTAKELRYRIPWVDVDNVIGWLRSEAERESPANARVGATKVAVMGDDGEKFGMWPRTYPHCWERGWIENFFSALEANSDWLETTTLADYARTQPSLGQIYMPAASYDEMTEWALPAEKVAAITHLKHDLQDQGRDDILQFVKGGLWRGFQSKYAEVNQMTKKALYTSRLVREMPEGAAKDAALEQVWAAQCNCGYWHGLFGGVYLFHIRGANYRNLIAAETAATAHIDLAAEVTDFTCNGAKDVIMFNRKQWLLIEPSNGGALTEWDLRDAPYNILNTVTRREEGYHQEIRNAAAAGKIVLETGEGEVENVHGGAVKVREYGLEHKLVADWYRRAALQVRCLDAAVSFETWAGTHGEEGDFVNQPFQFDVKQHKKSAVVKLWRDGNIKGVPVRVVKTIKLAIDSGKLTVKLSVTNNGDHAISHRIGLENNYGLEGGQDPWTYFEGLETAAGERQYPGQPGQVAGNVEFGLLSSISSVRSKIWQKVSAAADVWWHPFESVTNSEAGYEANYQGTAVLSSWLVTLDPGATWDVTVTYFLDEVDV